jgi:hypothetical protein
VHGGPVNSDVDCGAAMIEVQSAGYITIDNLILDGAAGRINTGLCLAHTFGPITVQNSDFRNMQSVMGGIYTTESFETINSPITIKSNVITGGLVSGGDPITASSNTVFGGISAFVYAQTSYISNNVVADSGINIETQDGDAQSVTNNTVIGSIPHQQFGISITAFAAQDTNSNVVSGNKVFGAGIYLFIGEAYGSNNSIYGNTVVRGGIMVTDYGTSFLNNSIDKNSVNDAACGLTVQGSSAGLSIYGNRFLHTTQSVCVTQ